MRKAFDQNVGAMGITRSRWVLIATVSRRPGATQKTIAEALDMTEASVGRLIDRLCTEGVLERRPKEDDRRAYCIFLTEKALPMLAQLAELGAINETKALAGFNADDLAQLSDLLDRVYANVAGQKDEII